MKEIELKEILKKHKKWLNDEEGGERANLSYADLSGADLRNADLSCAEGLPLTSDYLKEHFEFTADGMIAYKVFAGMYTPPKKWVLQPSSVITENVNPNRTDVCGCGINVASLDWVREEYPDRDIWKILIRYEWLCGIVVPYNTDGKIRCEKAELVEIVK